MALDLLPGIPIVNSEHKNIRKHADGEQSYDHKKQADVQPWISVCLF